MSGSSHDIAFPRGALIAVACLVGFSLAAVTAVRLTGDPGPVYSASAAHTVVDLVFVDLDDGWVEVYEASDRRPVATLEPGTANFVRGVLRGLVRERRAHGEGKETPFRLTRHIGGELTLTDPTTGRTIFLQAFGETNAHAFESLLAAGSNNA